jgi:hypothetical protein
MPMAAPMAASTPAAETSKVAKAPFALEEPVEEEPLPALVLVAPTITPVVSVGVAVDAG